jgi:hypothetical protein
MSERKILYRIDWYEPFWTEKFKTYDIGEAALAMTLLGDEKMPELTTYWADTMEPTELSPYAEALAEAFDGLRNG